MRQKISIILPCHDEAEAIGEMVSRVVRIVRDLDYAFEIVCVDDGSRDGTLDVMLSLEGQTSAVDLIIVELSRRFGKEAAITAGLDAATGDACIILDADQQDPPELIGQLIDGWRAGHDVVAVRRAERSADSVFKRSTAGLFYKFNNLVAECLIPENVGDCRIIDRSVVTALQQLPENRRFMKGLFTWVGFRTAYVDTKREPRLGGSTKFSTLRLINFALEGITSFSTSLLRLWMVFGMFVAVYAFLHGAYIMIRVLVMGIELPGYASMLVVVLFLGGIQMVGLGIIGEYVGRIYSEAKRRPIYLVRRTHRSSLG